MFDLGRIILTNGIQYELSKRTLTSEMLYKFLGLHLKNISKSCEDDRKYNLEDIKNKYGRVLNKYTIYENEEIFIDTYLGEINQTTIMLADEY